MIQFIHIYKVVVIDTSSVDSPVLTVVVEVVVFNLQSAVDIIGVALRLVLKHRKE